ncbi:hypothetical protein KDW_42270 [Dictyobacter vulcani]|uniref:Uncharacterized protein n=1 Tax=Dictyobacter vulcani TaxID=2607529 RepID=A0A5J4KQD3_9CHLR|nr:hypothetical protein KDW_42270 [Dictyobacter vulcani]
MNVILSVLPLVQCWNHTNADACDNADTNTYAGLFCAGSYSHLIEPYGKPYWERDLVLLAG